MLQQPDAWVQYNSVQFGSIAGKTVTIKTESEMGGTLLIKTDDVNGPVVAEVKIPKSIGWQNVKATLAKSVSGTQNLVIQLKDAGNVAADWIKFD